MGSLLSRYGCGKARNDDMDIVMALNRPPAFNIAAPEQWFADIEEHFEKFHISSDQAKCELIIDELDWDILQLIHNLEQCSPNQNQTQAEADNNAGERYENIKSIILQNLFAKKM